MTMFITADETLKTRVEDLMQLAKTNIPVLLVGESGVGKDVLARTVHQRSRRCTQPFVPINCAAVQKELLESLLFGHVKGSFTGAGEARSGLFREAHSGTLFLDEIGDMPLELQPKLLRAIESRQVRPVGGMSEFPADVRFIAATNLDIEGAVAAGTFRQDLFYRIAGEVFYIPPLRRRRVDIPVLLEQIDRQYFVQEFGEGVSPGFLPETVEWAVEQRWPGNVRELQFAILRGRTKAGKEEPIRIDQMQQAAMKALVEFDRRLDFLETQDADVFVGAADIRPMAEYIREIAESVVGRCQGNKTHAAKLLGVSARTMRQWTNHGVHTFGKHLPKELASSTNGRAMS